MDQPSLYETDILAWAEQQAAALRGLAGRRDLPNALDLANVIEEIETLGRTELKAATSPIRSMLEHLVELAFDPGSSARRHWRAEIVGWHIEVKAEMTPAMHPRVQMDALWRQAVRRARAVFEEQDRTLPQTVPTSCPFVLEDFLADEFDTDGAVARLSGRATLPGA